MEKVHILSEGAIVLVNFIQINFQDINSLIFFLFNFVYVFIARHIPTCTECLSLIIIDGQYYKEVKTKLAYIQFFSYPLYHLLHRVRKISYIEYLW